MWARYVPHRLVEEYIAQGWRLSRPLHQPHATYAALMVRDDE
tara:strand:- start:16122 stop:16247 length:126 start_codon:yes stop_codon:yes gene_type:complete